MISHDLQSKELVDVMKYSNTTATVMDQAVTEQLNASNHHIYEQISQWENCVS